MNSAVGRKEQIKRLIFTGSAVRWPFQIVVFMAIYYVTVGLLEILLGGYALSGIFRLFPAVESTGSLRTIAFDVIDSIQSILTSAALIFVCRLMNRELPLSFFGLPAAGRHSSAFFILGLALGAAAISAVVFTMTGLGYASLSHSHARPQAVSALVSLFFAAVLEEVLARGVMQGVIAQQSNMTAAILIPSVLFGLIHIGNEALSPAAMFNVILAGIMLAVLTYRTGGINAAVGFHLTWNYLQGVVFGLPVSGVDLSDNALRTALRAEGPNILTGGCFGPEGTVFCTAAFAVILIFCLIPGRRRSSEKY